MIPTGAPPAECASREWRWRDLLDAKPDVHLAWHGDRGVGHNMDGLLEQDNTQLVCTVAHGSEVLGYLVIDCTIGGRSSGGLRMMPDIDEAELRGLARTMTLKFGFLGMPVGGAKAGLRGDPEAPQEERRLRLAAFARAIAPLLLTHVYSPGTDMGTDNEDIRYVLQTAGMRVSRAQLQDIQSGDYTALTVLSAAKQAVRHIGLTLPQCAVAIEGWGRVGSALGGLLAEANARVVAISTLRGAIFNPQGLDVKQLQRLGAESGSHVVELYEDAQPIERAALLELPVHVLCPCARHNSVHAGNAERVAARIICPGANNPVTPEAERILFERGVLCLPDFVTNCGGVLGSSLESASVSKEQIASFIDDHIGTRITWLLDEAARQQVSPRDIAVPLVLKRLEQMRRYASRPTPLTLVNQLQKVAGKLYERGLVAGRLSAAVMASYHERSLAW